MNNRALVIAFAASLAPCAVHAQGRDFSKVEVKAQQLADGVYMLRGAGGNIGVSVGDDGIVIIDDEYAPVTPKVEQALAKLSPKPVRFVINTHWHGDHTGGNERFGKAAGSVIVAHDNVRRRMSEKQFIELFTDEVPPSPREALPIVTFSQDLTIHYNGEDLHVFHIHNAHTDGDGLIWFTKANVLHMGDTYFNGLYPFIDTSSGGSIDGMIRAVDHVLGLVNAQTKIIPGHGPLATRADLQNYRVMLATLRERIGALVRQGKTLEQAIAAAPTKELDPVWGKGFLKPEKVVEMVYADLKRAVK